MNAVEPIRDRKKINAIKGNLKRRDPRNFLLFTLGINTALRISDILGLKVEDVKETSGEIKEYLDINEQKSGKQRHIYINAEVKSALEFFFNKTRLYDLDRYLFTAHQKNKNVPISRVRAWQMIRDWCNQVGVRGRLGTHTLRKSAGYHMRMAGVPIEMIAEVLGHRSTTITKRYIGITNDEVTKVLKNFNL
jgi:integrase